MKYLFLFLLVVVSGCNKEDCTWRSDKEKQHIYFVECLAKIPKGPDNVKYNDWSEVVAECGSQARDMAWGHYCVPYNQGTKGATK